MGYYGGAGVTSSGGSTVAPFQTYLWSGFHTVYQRTTTVTNTKAGVALATAQSVSGDCNLRSNTFYIGSSWFIAFNCLGTKSGANYNRLADSNLYVLQTTSETYQAKIDSGSWVS